MTLRILHLDDNPDDMELIRIALARGGVDCNIDPVSDRHAYVSALERTSYDVILSDSGIPGFDGVRAQEPARRWATPV